MAEEKKYPSIEELLGEGKHIIKVKPHPEFEDRKPVEGTHRSGKTKWGNWYMYDAKINDQWVSVFANDDNKEFFDTGTVIANIVPKRMKGMEGDLFDANGKKLLKAFYNEFSEVDKALAEKDETINVEDVPF